MYDDLIKRLRINGAGNPKNIFDEAADAIEKLSADLASNGETIYKLMAENERLNKENFWLNSMEGGE